LYLDSEVKVLWHREHSKDRAGVISNLAIGGLTDEPAKEARFAGDGASPSEDSLPREDGDREEFVEGCA
jgi:hypothetical protein